MREALLTITADRRLELQGWTVLQVADDFRFLLKIQDVPKERSWKGERDLLEIANGHHSFECRREIHRTTIRKLLKPPMLREGLTGILAVLKCTLLLCIGALALDRAISALRAYTDLSSTGVVLVLLAVKVVLKMAAERER